jgi:hypothetical protein
MSVEPYRWGARRRSAGDLALAWGPVLGPPFAGRISYYQYARFYFWRTREPGLDRATIVCTPRTTSRHSGDDVPAPRRTRALRAATTCASRAGSSTWTASTTRASTGHEHDPPGRGPELVRDVYLERLTVGERVYE